MEPLTGKDAVEAIGLATRLGNSDARFDRRKLGAALRSRAGRFRIVAGLTLAVRTPFSRGNGTSRETARRRPGRPQRAATAAAAPDRPDEPSRRGDR